ncbi:MAG: carboxylesterase/lipase family protein [Mycobacterium sp.]
MHEQIIRDIVNSGIVEGFTQDGVTRWRSIPYARPPIGQLRFRAPQPVEPWTGVRRCHDFAYCAPQEHKSTMLRPGNYQPMSEDCLTLNVTAPESPAEQPLPVIVFIHGGAYVMGSSATPIYDGAGLARQGCVFVSVNYRLGALGALDLSSLSTAEVTIEDNLFMRDLVMALRWVHDNIAAFGGDPGNVTIVGESAGAHAVVSLLAVPAAKGLFAQAISESPARALIRSPDIAAEFAARYVGLLGVRVGDAADALMAARPDQLVTAQGQLIAQGIGHMLGAFPFGPTFGTDYLPVNPVEAMRSGTANQVPLIVGTNAEEGRLFAALLKKDLAVTQAAVERLLAGAEPAQKEKITAAYPGYPDPAACIRLGGDLAFGSAVWQIAEAHSRVAPTYLYQYDYAPGALRWSGLGATHATELLALFDVYRAKFGGLLTSPADRSAALRVSDDVQSRWLAFGRTGVPGDDWPTYSTTDRAVMVFDRESRVEYDPHAIRRQAWEGFSPTTG